MVAKTVQPYMTARIGYLFRIGTGQPAQVGQGRSAWEGSLDRSARTGLDRSAWTGKT
jgi:hypothetical protein